MAVLAIVLWAVWLPSRIFGQNAALEFATVLEEQETSLTDGIYSLALTRDGKTVLTGHRDGEVRVWDRGSGKVISRLRGHKRAVFATAVTLDGAVGASGSLDPDVCIWDLKRGKLLHRLREHQDSIISLSFSEDGALLGSGGADHNVCVWDVRSGVLRCKLKGHKADVRHLRFFPDNRALLSGSFDGTVIIWDLKTKEKRVELDGRGKTFASTSQFLAEIRYKREDRNSIAIADLLTGRVLSMFPTVEDSVQSLALSHDGRMAATFGKEYQSPICIWEVKSGKLIRSFPNDWVGRIKTSLAFSTDGHMLLSCANDARVVIWQLNKWPSDSKVINEKSDIHDILKHVGNEDAAIAHHAVWALVARKEATLELLNTVLKPSPKFTPQHIRELIAALDHKTFPRREEASRDLMSVASSAEGPLRSHLTSPSCSLEQRARITKILEGLEQKHLLEDRLLSILEYNGTAGAKDLLMKLASGDPGAFLTKESRNAMSRFSLRTTIP
jgi:hypothetical protein